MRGKQEREREKRRDRDRETDREKERTEKREKLGLRGRKTNRGDGGSQRWCCRSSSLEKMVEWLNTGEGGDEKENEERKRKRENILDCHMSSCLWVF